MDLDTHGRKARGHTTQARCVQHTLAIEMILACGWFEVQ